MRTRTTAIILSALLAFGAVACDDTVEGIQEDSEAIGEEINEGIEDAAED